MIETPLSLVALAIGICVGVGVGAPAYHRFLRGLEREHPDVYEVLGRPTLWNGEPRKSLALQRFIHSGSRKVALEPGVARLCGFLRWFTPALVVGIFASIAWLGVELSRAFC